MIILYTQAKKIMEETKQRKDEAIRSYLAGMATMDEEVRTAELKKFSAVERANIKATEYIAAESYPPKHVNNSYFKLSLKYKGKVYYPIVGWDPDSNPTSTGLIPPMRRWLNARKQTRLFNRVENRTYTLYD